MIYHAIQFAEMVLNVVGSFLSKLNFFILLRENITLFAHFRLQTEIIAKPYTIQFSNEVSNFPVIFFEQTEKCNLNKRSTALFTKSQNQTEILAKLKLISL